MDEVRKRALQFHLGEKGPEAVIVGSGSRELTLAEFRALSHQHGLQQIARAIGGLADAVHMLADAVNEHRPPEA
jgi:hypothetical protein